MHLANSMRYSRMLEESSFANRKADYFWLLFLSSLMLLVRSLFLFLSPLPNGAARGARKRGAVISWRAVLTTNN
jgi:hypothetical protein